MSTANAAPRTPPVDDSRRADALRLALIAFGYAVTLKLALFFPDAAGVLAAVWPPGGVALAALLLSPRRQRRSILATVFLTGNLVNLVSGRPVLASVGFMVANVLESWGGAWLFARWCGERRVTFTRLSEVAALFACAILVNGVSAVVGAAAALLAIDASFHGFYLSWWISDGMGILLVTPLVVACAQPWRWRLGSWLRQLEAIALGFVWVTFSWFGFIGATTGLHVVPRPYWSFVPVVWAGLRFGTRVTAMLLVLLAVISVGITVTGRGVFPLGGADPVEHLQMVQVFLGVAVVTGLTLAAVVAERKVAEEALRVSERKYRVLVENQSDLVVQFDPANRIQFVSPTYCATFGRSDAELLGTSFFPLVHEEDRTRVEAAVQSVLMPPFATQYEGRNLTLAGWRWFAWSIKAVVSPEGRVTSIIGAGRDVSKRKEAEEALRRSEERFKSVVTAMAEGTVLQSADGAIIDCNPQAERILGLTRDQLLGRTSVDPRWRAVKEDGSPFAGEEHPAMVTLRTGRRSTDVVMGVHLPGSEKRWININAEPMMRPGETKPYAVVTTFADITERIEQQQTLRKLLAQAAQDSRAKGELLREVNHRVTNNLTAVLGLLAFESRYARGDPQSIGGTLKRLSQRIRGLLQVHRMLSQSSWAPVPVSELAGQIIRAALHVAPWRQSAVLNIGPSEVRVSPRQAGTLAMVINELATNTVKHAHRGADAVVISFAAVSESEFITLRYQDNGPGYPPEVLAQERSNVGLLLIREMVDNTLGGSVELANDGGAVTILRISHEEETRT